MTDYTVPSTKIYSEDDYFAEKYSQNYHLKCDHSIQTPEPPLPFNYSRFNEYLKLKKQIECCNRFVEASKGGASPGLDYYTDQRLQTELLKVYGDLDEQSERFLLIFQNYKEQRLEEVKEWIEKEEAERGNGVGDDDEFLEEEEFLLQYFTEEEISSFKAVATTCSSKSVVNPFVLPRKPLSKADNSVKKKSSLSANKRSRNSNKGYLAQRNELVTFEVKACLQQYPMGLTRCKLLQICNERLGRKAPPGVIMSLNSDMIDGYLSKEKILVTRPFFQEQGLIFPVQESLAPTVSPISMLSYSINPIDYLWSMRHRMLVLLNLCMGIEEVNQCIELYNKIFKCSKFPFNDWGFDTHVDLIKYLFVQKWNVDEVEMVQFNSEGMGTKTYLAVMTDKTRKFLETKKSQVESKKMLQEKTASGVQSSSNAKRKKGKSTGKKVENVCLPTTNQHTAGPSSSSLSLSAPESPWNKQVPAIQTQQQPSKPPILNYDIAATFIDSKYVQIGNKIIREENEIKPGVEFDCVVALLKSPTNIFLVRSVRWKQLEKLFGELGDYWISHPTALCPHPRFLQRNYFCLAKTDNKEEIEVYRVVVLANPDPNHYQVFCIDYGDILVVRHDQLRYMPINFLHFLDAQAISCSLYNVSSPTKDRGTGSDVWSKDVCDYTKKLLIPDDLPIVKVLFKQRMQGTGKWLIKASSNKSNDFGEDVMKFVNKRKS